MKYIITEEKITSVISNYLDNSYGDLNWEYIDADYEEGEDTDCGVVFYKGDYSDLKKKFRLYEECWWVEGEWEGKAKSPIVIFENPSEYKALESYFGNRCYDKDFYTDLADNDSPKFMNYLKKYNIVELEDQLYYKYESMFEDLWKPVFLKWFNQHSGLPIDRVQYGYY